MRPGTIVIGRLNDSRMNRPRKRQTRGFGDLGTYSSIQAIMRAMDQLAPTEGNATLLRNQGIAALDYSAPWILEAGNPAGSSARDLVRAHLQYYVDNPDQLGPGFWDVKQWTVRAWIEYNAALQASRTQDVAQGQFLGDSLVELQNVTEKIVATATGVAGTVLAAGAGTTASLLWATLKGFLSSPGGLMILAGGAAVLYFYAGPTLRRVFR